MRIAHICQFLGVGGLEKVLFTLIKEQKALGHEVKVVVYDHDKRWVPMFRNEGIEVVDDYQKKAGYDFGLLPWLKEHIADSDIVHTHDLNPMLYVGVLRVKGFFEKKPGIKLLHTTHGMEHLQTHPKTRFYEMFLGLAAQKIVTVSPDFSRHYLDQWATAKEKVALIENGTNVKNTPPRSDRNKEKIALCKEYGLNPSLPLAVYVGRVSPLKGQLELVRFYNTYQDQLLIVGPATDQKYYDQCNRLCGPNIVMTGGMENIKEILRGCDYFISTSKHEGMPIAALEAGALGLPCILSDIPGHRNFNQKEKCVILFSSLEELPIRIEEVRKDGESISRRFHSLIYSRYSSRAMALRYLSLYQELSRDQSC